MIESSLTTTRSEIETDGGMVVGGHQEEARAGARILAEGGNAVDALVAAAFTAYVVEPWNCGIGGYGHLAVFVAERNELVTVDHYLRAPLRARPDMYEVDTSVPPDEYELPHVLGRRNLLGHLSVGVPGAVAG